MRLLLLLTALALSACGGVQPPPDPEPSTTPPANTGSTAAEEMPLHDSEAPEVVQQTGSLLVPERQLPSGALEMGAADAPNVLLVFTEFHCDYCADFQREQVPLLLQDFVHAKTLRLQFVPLVLNKYPASAAAAKGVLCAAAQGNGSDMQHALFAAGTPDENTILRIAGEQELDTDTMAACLSGSGTQALLRQQQAWARSLRVTHVPTFFLNGEKFVGLPYYADLRGRIEEMQNAE